jgi:TonB family protein
MMEAFSLYLLKSISWLSGFTLIFILFLRNERFFRLKRLFLFSGAFFALLLPFISLNYSVKMTLSGNVQAGNAVVTSVNMQTQDTASVIVLLIWAIYLSGLIFIALRHIIQSKTIIKVIKKTKIETNYPVKLIRTAEYPNSFSFFSFVFVNPSVTKLEAIEIMNHEKVHIRQKHWIDLALGELLCLLQWFNPLSWFYIRLIKQNHEYLADEVALQHTSDPAIYKAALLNQIVGYPVINLTNSFNYSLNKKRFEMMKNKISSPYRKLKVLLILPVFAIILYSFAKPVYEYSYKQDEIPSLIPGSNLQKSNVKGFIKDQNNEALIAASILISGTTNGTLSDENGFFQLENVPQESLLIISFVSFKTINIKPVFSSDMIITMIKDTVKFKSVTVTSIQEKKTGVVSPNEPRPLVIIDGIEKDIEINKIDPESIESVNIIKDKAAVEKYGEKAKNGAIEVHTKAATSTASAKLENSESDNIKSKGEVFYIVEDMPKFPGGGEGAMQFWISQNTHYPTEALSKKISGEVTVNFTVNGKGKITNVNVPDPVNALLDAEAIRVISAMPDWQPGKQRGKNVSVRVSVPVNFKLD